MKMKMTMLLASLAGGEGAGCPSALHVDRGWLGETEGERSLRTKLDVALRGDKRHCGSGGCADGPSDGCAHSSSGQGTDQDASAGPAANPQQVVLLVAAAKFTGSQGVNGIVLPVHLHGLQREQQSRTALEASRFLGLN